MLRVISGIRKGHKLTVPKGNSIRPTEDRVKESLFNILSPIKKEAIVLDLFAGIGSIGIEFLSRGAKKAFFVDKNPESIVTIKKNLEHTKLANKAKVIRSDSQVLVKKTIPGNPWFDYIYIDPPYAEESLFHKTIQLIAECGILASDGIVIVEHDRLIQLKEQYLYLNMYDSRDYGSKKITFYKIKGVTV